MPNELDYDVSMVRDFFNQLRLEIKEERVRVETGDICDISSFGEGLSSEDKAALRELRDKHGDGSSPLVKQHVADRAADFGHPDANPSDKRFAEGLKKLRDQTVSKLQEFESAIQVLLPVLDEAFARIDGDIPWKTGSAEPISGSDDAFKIVWK